MPDGVGVVPQPEVLQAPNTQYRRPENPMERLKAMAVLGAQDEVRLTNTRPLVATYNADTPQEVTAAPVEPYFQEQAPQPAPEIKGSPYARIRVLERERELERKRAQDLQEQVVLLAKVVDRSGILEEDEEEEEIDLDPLSQLQRGQQDILDRFDNIEKQATAAQEQRVEMTVKERANQQIIEFAQRADQIKPGLYQDATVHLINVKMAELLEDNDSITSVEAAEQVTSWIASVKDKAVRSGKNPGEEFLKRSILHGFTMPVPTQAGNVPTQKWNVESDAAQRISRERERKQSLGSISTVGGAPANDPMRNTAAMSEKDRVHTILAAYRERGSFRRGGTLQETLAHKIRQ